MIPAPAAWQWFGISIGSTSNDLSAELGEPRTRQPFVSDIDGAAVCVYAYSARGTISSIWLKDGRVAKISFDSHEIPLELEAGKAFLADAVSAYGRPEIIGYSRTFGSGTRVAVWTHFGVEAEVSITVHSQDDLSVGLTEAQIISIGYFAPLSVTDYLKSYQSVAFSTIPIRTDVVDMMPLDPFRWNE